jgi:hypothetical protein
MLPAQTNLIKRKAVKKNPLMRVLSVLARSAGRVPLQNVRIAQPNASHPAM